MNVIMVDLTDVRFSSVLSERYDEAVPSLLCPCPFFSFFLPLVPLKLRSLRIHLPVYVASLSVTTYQRSPSFEGIKSGTGEHG